jgi:hypothetical protein
LDAQNPQLQFLPPMMARLSVTAAGFQFLEEPPALWLVLARQFLRQLKTWQQFVFGMTGMKLCQTRKHRIGMRETLQYFAAHSKTPH